MQKNCGVPVQQKQPPSDQAAPIAKAPATPFMKTPTLDINQYVLDKSTDGLFVAMGQEEGKIRTDLAAQVTPLLKTVFGGR